MKKIILIIGLGLMSSNAMAEWVHMTSIDSGSKLVSFYVEDSEIKVSGDKRRGWMMVSLSSPETVSGHSFLSSTSQYEYDCFKETSQLLSIGQFSLKMGYGDVVWAKSFDNAERHRILFGTAMNTVMKYFCNVK